MHAEIIAIGDEVTSGQLLDTNTKWLSQRLEELGLRVLYHTAVGDELSTLSDVFRLAFRRADVVVSTGGLGPTADDLVREALAAALDRRLVLDRDALAHIRDLFSRRNRPMPERNEVQALFPEGSQVIPNRHGTAPGIALEVPREGKPACRFFALPGVPPEMKQMWAESVSLALRGMGGRQRTVYRRNIKCFGAGESAIESMLPDLIRRGRTPRVGINASKTTIVLRIAADGADEEECAAAIEPVAATIHACLGKLVFGEGDDELQHAVARLLRQQGKTLATFEWGTAGLVAEWMGEAEEARGFYRGGFVVTDETALCRMGGATHDLLARHTATSGQVAERMASACRTEFGAEYGLAVTRFPPADPSPPEPALFYVGLAAPGGVHVAPIPYAGHPATLKIFCAKQALNVVRLALLG